MSWQESVHSPTYNSPNKQNSTRLYQQLLENNYLHDNLYSTEDNPLANTIKFSQNFTAIPQE